MPIVDIRFVASAGACGRIPSAQGLADVLGEIFRSEPGRTWVRLHSHDASLYAESGVRVGDDELPVFVCILLADLPAIELRVEQARTICAVMASCFARPPERVHCEYAPAGTARIAFGGVLMA